jgi:hypothetical protein
MNTAGPNSFLDRPPYIYFWRPLYRRIVLPFVHPLLAWMRNYFLGHLSTRLDRLDAHIAALNTSQTALAGRFESRYLDSLGQWSEMEHMILSSVRMLDSDVQKQSARIDELLKQLTALQTLLRQESVELASFHTKAVEQAVAQSRAIQQEQSEFTQRCLSQNRDTWDKIEELLLILLAQHEPAHFHAPQRSSAVSSE